MTLLPNTPKTFLLKHFSNTPRTLLKHFSNTSQTLLKHFSNTSQTLLNHFSNTCQTLLEHLFYAVVFYSNVFFYILFYFCILYYYPALPSGCSMVKHPASIFAALESFCPHVDTHRTEPTPFWVVKPGWPTHVGGMFGATYCQEAHGEPLWLSAVCSHISFLDVWVPHLDQGFTDCTFYYWASGPTRSQGPVGYHFFLRGCWCHISYMGRANADI